MKRLLSVLFVAVLAIACMSMSAFAAGTVVSVSDAYVNPDETVTVDVSITGNTGFETYLMALTYDNTKLELVEVTKGELLGDSMFVYSADTGKVTAISTEMITGDGVLFTATFKAIAEDMGETPVGLDIDNIGYLGEDNQPVEVETEPVEDGTVNIHVCEPVAVEEVPASCEADGMEAHYKCEVCGKLYSDEAGTQEVTAESLVIEATGHSAEKVEAKDATATEDGNIEYWYCEACGKYFKDEALTEEISKEDTVIPATGEKPTDPTKPTDPSDPSDTSDTGDGGPDTGAYTNVLLAVLLIAAAGVAMGTVVYVQKKKAQ